MKALARALSGLAVALVTSLCLLAQDSVPVGTKPPTGTTTNETTPKTAKLQAQLHRATAELIVARSADQPDQARLDKLGKKIQSLRQQLQPLDAAPQDNPGPRAAGGGKCPNPQCPMRAGPQAGLGRGAGNCPFGNTPQGSAQARGQGRGQGWGGGQGRGRGQGWGGGQGRGRGQGWGGGQGRGRGQGGNGWGPGWGQGAGRAAPGVGDVRYISR